MCFGTYNSLTLFGLEPSQFIEHIVLVSFTIVDKKKDVFKTDITVEKLLETYFTLPTTPLGDKTPIPSFIPCFDPLLIVI